MTGKKRRKLRTGFTTGTAAAAAAKAAVEILLGNPVPPAVDIRLLTGDQLTIPIRGCHIEGDHAVCTVIKDAGDDPDVTHRALIGARAGLLPDRASLCPPLSDPVVITGGEGVGTVTKPGLEIPPGEPAINPGPRRMIREAITDVLAGRFANRTVTVEIFVPEGKRLALKTLNARLGILGGLSILGTTGLVKPLSHGAYIATIRSAMNVARASGGNGVVMTTGRRSERFAQNRWPELPEEAFIQIGDYFEMSCAHAARSGFQRATLAVFFGKAVKMAQGVPHTHAAKSRMTLERLALWTSEICEDPGIAQRVATANTARHALEILRPHHTAVITRVGREMLGWAGRFSGKSLSLQGVIFDYDGSILFDAGTPENGRVP